MEKIKVKNNLRRPVIFRVPGKTIRLGAGQKTELPGHFKEAQELKTLRLRKCVSVLEVLEEKTEEKEEKTGEKKEKPVQETGKIETKDKKPGKASKKAGKARKKKTGDTGGDKKSHWLEEE